MGTHRCVFCPAGGCDGTCHDFPAYFRQPPSRRGWPDDIVNAAKIALATALANHASGTGKNPEEVIADAIGAERARCWGLALDFASGTPLDDASIFSAYQMEELAEHIRRGDVEKKETVANDNYDMV